jgi:hypothetical protein
MAAELFSSILGEMAPRDDKGLGRPMTEFRQREDFRGKQQDFSAVTELREHTGLAEMSTVYGQRRHSVGIYPGFYAPWRWPRTRKTLD